MEEKEVQELLSTIDVLKLLIDRGRDERKGFAWYMVVWGFYGFINIVIAMFLGKLLWGPLTLPAFWLTTVPVAGWGLSTLCWGILSAVVFGLGYFAHVNSGILIAIIVAGAIFNYAFLYRYGIMKGRLKPLPKTSVAPKIGIFWGVVMASMIVLSNLVYVKTGYAGGDLIYGMWGYALGIAMFISGIIAPGFFIMGLIAAFGIPLMCVFSMEAGMALYGLVALLMALYGIYMIKK
ncbi:MAG TPA: hypothetical protein ENF18_01650 [candidate division WOR-3 bacterium]|uniref:Uncharacterized protein n=1 Tax=candidate division WOR-3 bacterium TaxID=2052148 RepID=A0A7C0ZCJ1_UNCW3|nr:hypothetical protein [candidate division WOR-3 bacterium]